MIELLAVARLLSVAVTVIYVPGVLLAEASAQVDVRIAAALAGTLVYATAYSNPSAVVLVLVAFGLWACVDAMRAFFNRRGLLWLAETVAWPIWLLALWLTAGKLGLRAVWSAPVSGLTASRESFLWLAYATVLTVVMGGAFVVRGVLAAASVRDEDAASQDASSAAAPRGLKGGRAIGYLERVTLSLVVAVGGIATAGFIIAAKGLARYPELKAGDENTEYFVIGTFTSALLGIASGLFLGWLHATLWR